MVVARFVFQVFQEEDGGELMHAQKTHIHYNAARFFLLLFSRTQR